MKIFITGATGYLGAALAKKLIEQGHIVHALVRSVEKLNIIAHQNLIPFKGDILDISSIRMAMDGCVQVYHLAAFAKVWANDSAIYYDQNVIATQNIMKIAKELKIEKIIYTSTGGVFGASIRGIINENSARDIDFFNEYEGSKALSESKIKDAVIQDNLNIVIVSPTRVYGPYLIGETSSVTKIIEDFYNNRWRIIMGDGSKIGNYIYIDDVVEAHIAAMEKGRKGHTYLLAGPNHTYSSFFDILRKCTGSQKKLFKISVGVLMLLSQIILLRARCFGKEPLIVPKWMAKIKYDWEVSPVKMETELGVKGRSLEDGINLTINWLNCKKG